MSDLMVIIAVILLGVIAIFAMIAYYSYKQGRRFERVHLEKTTLEELRDVERVAREVWKDIDSKSPARRDAARKRVLAEMRALANRSAKLSDIK